MGYRRHVGRRRSNYGRNGGRRWKSRGRRGGAGGRRAAIVTLGIAAAAAAAAAFLLLAGPASYDGGAWPNAGAGDAAGTPVQAPGPPPFPEPAITAAEEAAEQAGAKPGQAGADLRKSTGSGTHEAGSKYQEPPSEEELAGARASMLDMINAERDRAGLEPVAPGSNGAAQAHAENMLAGCSSSHWGLDGLKPYMRHTLAGGDQYNAENIFGLNYCVGESYMLESPAATVPDAMNGLMQSPGHRSNILDPHHATVNIGIASDWRNDIIVQHFEYEDALSFEAEPAIDENGVLSFAAAVTAQIQFGDSMSLTYDPAPHSLTQGQVARTYCYTYGAAVSLIVAPPEPGWRYDGFGTTYGSSTCPDPYEIPRDVPAPESPQEALRLQESAKDSSLEGTAELKVPIIVAEEWGGFENGRFDLRADVGDLADLPGVYTVTLYKKDGQVEVPITSYSIFHKVERPGGYD